MTPRDAAPVYGAAQPLRSGIYRPYQDGTVCYLWAVFSTADLIEVCGGRPDDARAREWCARELTGWERFYHGPGQSFADDPWLKIYGGKVLVTQRCGRDV